MDGVGEASVTMRRLLADALDRGMAYIAVNARADGVVLPDFVESPVVLKLSRCFGAAFPVVLAPDAIRATLKFRGSPHEVVIPYAAVVSMRAVEHEAGTSEPRPRLRLIQGGRS